MSSRWRITSECGGEYRCTWCGALFFEGEGEHRSGCDRIEDLAEANEAEAANETEDQK